MTAEEHLAQALAAIGFKDDPEMAATPALVTAMLSEFLPREPPPARPIATTTNDLVIVRDLQFHSLCAHHLLPFFGTCTIGLRPNGRVPGLGWYPRVLEAFARRPQVQERLVAQIADTIMAELSPRAVAVHVQARQMCVEMRGARASGLFEVRAWRGGPDDDLQAIMPS